MEYSQRLKAEILQLIEANDGATEEQLVALPVAQEAKLPWLVVRQALFSLRRGSAVQHLAERPNYDHCGATAVTWSRFPTDTTEVQPC